VVVARRRWQPGPDRFATDLLDLARRQWLPCGLIALMAGLGVWSFTVQEPLLPTVVANAAMVVFALWLIRVGLTEDRGKPFAAGVLYFCSGRSSATSTCSARSAGCSARPSCSSSAGRRCSCGLLLAAEKVVLDV